MADLTPSQAPAAAIAPQLSRIVREDRTIGPRKLILHNSAVYEDAEVPLDVPVHLAGDNNVGKTTLINALQFFYLDANSRRFPKKTAEALKFYFKEHSYLLLEVETPTGIWVLGVCGDPIKTGGLQYFAFEGAYDRILFRDASGTTRERKDIFAGLVAARNGKLLDPIQFRNAMTGIGDNGGVRLDLVPTSKFAAFTRVFRHLISLRATKDSDLKEMVLDSSQSIATEDWVLDLGRLCGEEYTTAKVEETRLKLLNTVKPQWDRLRTQGLEEAALRSRMPMEWTMLRIVAQERDTQALAHLRDAQDGMGLVEEEKHGLIRRKTDCDAIRSGLIRQQQTAKDTVAALERKVQDLAGLDSEARIQSVRDSKDRELTEVEVELRLASDHAGSAEGRKLIETRIRSAEQQLDRERKRLADPSMDSWSNRILAEYRPDEREKLLKLFNRDLFGLPEGEGGVTLHDEGALHVFLGEVLRAGGLEALKASSFTIDLTGLATPNLDIQDSLAIEQSIERLEHAAAKDRELLKGVSNLEAKRSERDQLARARQDLDRDLLRRQTLEEDVKGLPEARRELETLEIKLKAAEAAYFEANDAMDQLGERIRVAERDRDQAAKDLGLIRKDLAQLETFGANLGFEPLPLPAGANLPRASFREDLATFAEDVAKLTDLENQVAENLAITAEQLGGIEGATQRVRFEAVASAMDALPGLEHKLAKKWETMVGQAARGFYDMNEDLSRVRARVDAINRRLAKVQVSNLKGISIHMDEDEALMRPIREWLTASEVPMIEQEALERSQKVLASYLECNRQFHLESLFKLRIDVRRGDGSEESYNSLEAESTGTGITIKIVLLSMLLRDHLKGRDNVVLPMFVDEVDTLDDSNRKAVMACARDMGFRVMMAAPHAVPADRIMFLHSVKGKTIIRERESLRVKFALQKALAKAPAPEMAESIEAGDV